MLGRGGATNAVRSKAEPLNEVNEVNEVKIFANASGLP